MRREGKVTGISGENATVVLMKHSACGDCGACQMGQENMNIKIEALNNASAKVGDKVLVDMDSPDVLFAAFVGYGIPLIMLVIGIAGSSFLFKFLGMTSNIELYSLIIGALLLAATYMVIKKKDNKFKESKKYLSIITEVID